MDKRTFLLSENFRIFKKGENIAFFNSFNLEVYYADHELYLLAQKFKKPYSLEKALSAYNGKDKQVVNNILLELIKNNFLVESLAADKERESVWLKKYAKKKEKDFGNNSRLNALRIIMTEKCNLNCHYCFVREKNIGTHNVNSPSISWETIKKAVDMIANINQGNDIELQFFGGEPIIEFRLIKKTVSYANSLVKKGKIEKVFFGITTNGTLITDEIAIFLKKNNFLVSLSLDGSREQNDDNRFYFNGRGSYDDAIRGLKILKKFNNFIGILVTPSAKKIKDLAKSCEYIIKELDYRFITINTPQPMNGNWEVDGVLFAEELKKCFQIAKKTNSIINHFGTRVLYALNNKKPMIYGCSKYGDNYTATLTVDGLIGPCIVSWQHKETLSGLDNFNLPDSPLKKWKFDKPYYFKKCLECVARNVCGGPCPLEVYEYKKLNKKIDHERCRFFRNFICWAIWYKE